MIIFSEAYPSFPDPSALAQPNKAWQAVLRATLMVQPNNKDLVAAGQPTPY